MREYIPAQYKNLDESLKEIESLIKVVDNKLFSIGLDYVNKINGQLKNDKFYEIRDSIILRIDSIIFHYKILSQIYNPENPLMPNESFPLIIDTISLHQKYLFDSIIFNIISLFDYLAKLINIVIVENKKASKKNWKSLAKNAYTDQTFKQTKLSSKIIQVNNDWVKNLYSYRDILIHHKTEDLPSQRSYNVMLGSKKVLVLAPSELKIHFEQLNEITEKEDYNINSISLWIIKTCIESIIEIQDEIKVYIEEHRKIPDDKAIYT